jgi:RNA polymerase sigma factor (sigma-70 family)
MAAGQLGVVLRHIHRLAAGGRREPTTDRQLLEAFAVRRDEAAFTDLVARHGTMVLRVCRRVLRHEQDAEDAFQATFLVLARNSGSIRKREALAGWLYGVAYRTAMKAKRSAARRRDHEGRAGAAAPRAAADPTWSDVQAALDEEVERLPGPFRAAFALCVLEGKSVPEAAAALGCKAGTVSSRVTRARRLLRERLARRGIVLSAVLAALAVAGGIGRAAVPAALAKITVRYGLLVAAGLPAAGQVPPHLAALAEGVTGAMITSKLKVATAVLLAVVLVAGAGALAWQALTARGQPGGQKSRARGEGPEPMVATEAADSPAGDGKGDSVEVRGRVLDPDGKPVRGAKLLFLRGWARESANQVSATTSAGGEFLFTVPRPRAANVGWEMPGEDTYVLAAVEGYGFAAARLSKPGDAAGLTLRLVKDDVPIQGRVLDLQGKPVAGATVRISGLEPLNLPQLYVPKTGDLTDWLAALQTNKKDPWDTQRAYLTVLAGLGFDQLVPPVTTREDGRFQVRGLGRERLARLRIDGPTIATQVVYVMTRPCEKIRLPLSRRYPRGETITYYGAAFEVLAEPTRPVVGVVRDGDTGKPVPGVTVEPSKVTNPFDISNYNAGLVRTTTDKDGRYRLLGLPKGDDNQVVATTNNLPYVPAVRTVENTPGLEPVTVDFVLRRGIWVKGRVTEKGTGKPLQAGVVYYCFSDNPNAKENPPTFDGPTGGRTGEDGSFQLVALSGRGVIAVQVSHNDRYLSGVGIEHIKGPRTQMGDIECLETSPSLCRIWDFNALVEIAPRPGDESITCDVTVVPGRSLTGTVVGPDGKSLTGARQFRDAPLSGSEFTVWGINPDKPQRRVLEFVHDGKKLAGLLVLRGDEKGPLQVRLEPWGELTGRLLTTRGEPLTCVRVSCAAGDAYPDKNGQFRIEGLTRGQTYKVYVSKEGRSLDFVGGRPKDVTLKAGETKDLGDLRVKEVE